MTWSTEAIPAKSSHTVSRVVDEETVIVEPGNGMVNVISATGSRIWEMADGTRTVKDIAGIISAEYDVSQKEALTDVQDFLSDMEDKKLVKS